MALEPGVRLGPYEILSALGAGGMGEVWKARDTTLGRDVALKILPDHFALDSNRLVRFKREAQILASLNHPNIAAIYGFQEADGMQALVLELVEGPTLADRIAHGPIPVEEALPIAKQIAEALEAAHELGIIHRDLKPANIKLRPDGTVKVLDFGLAKAIEPAAAGAPFSVSMSPTITSPAATYAGVILGTAAYMSPEQARGKPVDKRADVWAFGCVLYEMLTARRAFPGEDVSETLASVLKVEPNWSLLPPVTWGPTRALLRRCLQKDATRRLRDIADARFQIEEALIEAEAPEKTASAGSVRERLSWAAALLVAVASTAATAWYVSRPTADAPEARLQIITPPGNRTSLAISPDGRHVVFQANTGGQTRLWIRPLESEVAEPMAGTEGGVNPFWSPDSRSVGFFADQKLKRVDLGGRTARTLADAPTGGALGGTWGPNDTILFAPGGEAGIHRVSSSGGEPAAVTHVVPPQQTHRFPWFLPDGRHFFFFATGAAEARGVHLGPLDGMEARRLFDADSAAVFSPPGHVLFARQGTLFAQRIDLRTYDPLADAFPVAERVVTEVGLLGSVALSASIAGPLAYRTAAPVPRQLLWFDRAGKQIGSIGEPDLAEPGQVRLSPDGRTVALARTVNGNQDVWLVDVARGIPRRFTTDPARDSQPTWSRDGERVYFVSTRAGGGFNDIYEKPFAGGTEVPLLVTSENKNLWDPSPDGRFLLFNVQSPKTARDLWVLALDKVQKPSVLLQTAFEETSARFSPDARWIAYTSNETGSVETYVQPFPGPGRGTQISKGGGGIPHWSKDQNEIFYLAPDRRLMAVALSFSPDGSSVEARNPIPLFGTRAGSGLGAAPDGQRFLINTPLEDDIAPPITVVLNWPARKRD